MEDQSSLCVGLCPACSAVATAFGVSVSSWSPCKYTPCPPGSFLPSCLMPAFVSVQSHAYSPLPFPLSLSLPPNPPFPFFWSNCALRPGSFRFGRQAGATGECHFTPVPPPHSAPLPACDPSCLSHCDLVSLVSHSLSPPWTPERSTLSSECFCRPPGLRGQGWPAPKSSIPSVHPGALGLQAPSQTPKDS